MTNSWHYIAHAYAIPLSLLVAVHCTFSTAAKLVPPLCCGVMMQPPLLLLSHCHSCIAMAIYSCACWVLICSSGHCIAMVVCSRDRCVAVVAWLLQFLHCIATNVQLHSAPLWHKIALECSSIV